MKRYTIMVCEFGSHRELPLVECDRNPEQIVRALKAKTFGDREQPVGVYSSARVVDNAGTLHTWTYNDGGRAAAGFKGKNVGDCVCRAISIATGKPYREVYDELSALGWREKGRYWRDPADGLVIPGERASALEREYIESLGWRWTPTMAIGSGCRVHLRADELPLGRLIVQVTHHLVAVIDGVIHDMHDCSRGGRRCVYGFYQAANERVL
jgi:hypothetical protein